MRRWIPVLLLTAVITAALAVSWSYHWRPFNPCRGGRCQCSERIEALELAIDTITNAQLDACNASGESPAEALAGAPVEAERSAVPVQALLIFYREKPPANPENGE